MVQLVKNPPSRQETPGQFLGRKIHWRRDRLSTPAVLGFPCGSAGKESTCTVGDLGLVKNLPAMRETWVRYLGWEDPLEKRTATHSSILDWRIPWTVYSPWSRKDLDTTE